MKLFNPHPECERCREYEMQKSYSQAFTYQVEPTVLAAGEPTELSFDIPTAEEIIQLAPRPFTVINPRTLPASTFSNICEAHILHVPADAPGIVCPVTFKLRAGNIETYNILIDGKHRAARCHIQNQPFRFYQLTEEETARIMTTDKRVELGRALKRILKERMKGR